MSVVSLPQLLEAGVHFGHKASRWNPKMRPYIFAERNGIHIIDLVQTARYLNEAYEYVREGAEKGWRFLFVGTKRQAAGIIAHEATRCGSYYVNQRWLGGHAHQLGHHQNPHRPPQGNRGDAEQRPAGSPA
jgi:small subunit ribosomal protein S2